MSSTDKKIWPVAVIGGGSAGTMAVLRTVLNNIDCLFFPGSPNDRKRSRAQWVSKVENMPAHFEYKRGIDQPNRETLKWIQESPFKDRLEQIKNRGITKLSKNGEGLFDLEDSKGDTYQAKYVILCTGVMDVQPEINGSIEPVFPYANAQTIDYCIRCDGHHVMGKHTSIIGHGNGAAWIACMLFERYGCPSMQVLTHGKSAEFSDEVKRLLDLYKIQVHESEIVEIVGNQKEAKLEGYRLADGNFVKTEFSFVSLGMIVYNELAKQVDAEVDERGFVVTDAKGHSSCDGLYVAGDLRANAKKQIYTAWDHAVDAADAIDARLRKEFREERLAQG